MSDLRWKVKYQPWPLELIYSHWLIGFSISSDFNDNVIDAFNTTSRYLDNILNINNIYFDNMVSQIYPSELQLNKAACANEQSDQRLCNSLIGKKTYLDLLQAKFQFSS